MDSKSPISDATITRNVNRQLAGCGLRSPCRIEVQTRNGEVTLSGVVQFVHQRNAAAQAIRTVEGVKRVIEKLKVTPPAKHQYAQPAHAPKPQPPEPLRAHTPDASAEVAAEAPEEPISPVVLSNESPHVDRSADEPASESGDTSFEFGAGNGKASPPAVTSGIHHTRSGDSYTFECASSAEAERLRVLLAAYADWLKKNAWVGAAKPKGDTHRVTFHAKSVIEFLRQEGF